MFLLNEQIADFGGTKSTGVMFLMEELKTSPVLLNAAPLLICLENLVIQYCNVPKFSDRQVWANSADPDQTAPRGAVWSESTLFGIPSPIFWMHYSKEKPSC